jgi:hypothetical protein
VFFLIQGNLVDKGSEKNASRALTSFRKHCLIQIIKENFYIVESCILIVADIFSQGIRSIQEGIGTCTQVDLPILTL